MDVAQLFNGVTLFSKFETPQSEKPASVERDEDDSYKIQITFTAKLPHPSRTLEDLAENDPKLYEVLSQMTRLVDTARVSPPLTNSTRTKSSICANGSTVWT
jgi:hypothetical protein